MSLDRLKKTLEIMGGFREWSPNELCHALGFRIDLRQQGNGATHAYIVGAKRERCVSHERASRTLARLARWRGIDPTKPPKPTRRALRNGQEQEG